MDNLTPDLAALFTAARARAADQGRVATSGAVLASPEAAAHHDAVRQWHADGKLAARLAALKAEERRLRRSGKF